MQALPPLNPSAFIFDLDGTLVDSRIGIEASLRAAAAEHGASLDDRDITREIGPPIREIVRRLLPTIEPAVSEAIAASYRRIYDGGGCLRAQLFPGINELLVQLRAASRRCFVVTNKPALPARLLLAHFAIDHFFEAVASPDDPVSPFTSKVDAVARLLRLNGIDSSRACVIGDAVDDAQAAAVNEVAFIAAAYGYGEAHRQRSYPVSFIAHQPLDLVALLPETFAVNS